MSTRFGLSAWVGRSLALSAFAVAASVAGAQSTSPAQTAASPLFSSSSQPEETAPAYPTTNTELASVTTPHYGLMNFLQYGGRRSGRPRYRGGNTNADGSAKYVFYVGGGFAAPTGPTHHVNTTSWSFQGGFGRNFTRNVGLNVEFNWDNFGLQSSTLNAQQNLYNNYISVYNATLPGGANNPNAATPIAGLDGYSHVWSFGLEPVYNIAVNEGLGAFVEGGAGFYHKITTFTVPAIGEYCDYYYGCYTYQANTPIDSYTSNAPGLNIGFGFTYKFSRFSHEMLYADARYVYMFNQYRPGVDASTCTTVSCAGATYNYTNDYRANSQRTSYIPVKFGLRF